MTLIRQRTLRAAIATLFVPVVFASAMLPLPVVAAPAAATQAVKPNAAFDKWADKFAEDWVRLNPQLATSTQYFRGAEQAALDRQLTPITQAQRAKTRTLAQQGLVQLNKWMAGPLDETQRTSAAVMRWSLNNVVANEPFEDHTFVFSQFSGVHVGLVNFMNTTHPLRRAADVDSYLARLDQIAPRIDEALVRDRKSVV